MLMSVQYDSQNDPSGSCGYASTVTETATQYATQTVTDVRLSYRLPFLQRKSDHRTLPDGNMYRNGHCNLHSNRPLDDDGYFYFGRADDHYHGELRPHPRF